VLLRLWRLIRQQEEVDLLREHLDLVERAFLRMSGDFYRLHPPVRSLGGTPESLKRKYELFERHNIKEPKQDD
jgi:hypothetical protein